MKNKALLWYMKQQTTIQIIANKINRVERWPAAGLAGMLLLLKLALIVATGIVVHGYTNDKTGVFAKAAKANIISPAEFLHFSLHQNMQQEKLHKKILHIKNNFKTFSKTAAEFFRREKLHKLFSMLEHIIILPIRTISNLHHRLSLIQETLAEYGDKTHGQLALPGKYALISNNFILRIAQPDGCSDYACERRKKKNPKII
ncbi:MAG: hypothetical protein JWQ27_2899 [Ferruginibacter sp.]|nr:hypothetical protein [Ferruginibacter sp.]